MNLGIRLVVSGLLASCFGATVFAAETIPLNVLYLARSGDAKRTAEFEELLSAKFRRCVVEKRIDFDKGQLQDIDVVVFDWSQQERSQSKGEIVLGEFEEWTKPIVFLGSAGLHAADSWQVIGDAG